MQNPLGYQAATTALDIEQDVADGGHANIRTGDLGVCSWCLVLDVRYTFAWYSRLRLWIHFHEWD
jgi:hypothetical protein